MSFQELKTVGYLNILSNDLICSENVYTTRKEAIESINKEISEKLYISFGISLEKKYMFSEIQNVSENRITTAENNSILIIKNTDMIDIYLSKVSRGYIYNTEQLFHYYKFFINNHTFYEKETVISPKLKAKLEDRKVKHNETVMRNDDLIKELKEKLEKLNIKS